MKLRLALLASYFILAFCFVFLLILYQVSLHSNKKVTAAASEKQAEKKVSQKIEVISIAEAEEIINVPNPQDIARIEALVKFFEKYNSPLAEFAREIVIAADEYGLDYRLLPAIAMQESTLCKKMPKESFNCWGFGIYGGKVTRFSDYAHAIDTISRAIARDYHAKGLYDPADIMKKYTPSNKGEWAENVSYVMGRIDSSL